MRRWHLLVGTLTLMVLALRLYRLAGQSLWYDEGVSAYVAGMPAVDLVRWTAADIQPPLYYLLLSLWTRLAGSGEYALRFPSACCGVLLVPLLYQTGRRLHGHTAGTLAALLGAIAPLYVYYGQEARMYTLLTFLGLLSSYLLIRALPEGQAAVRRRIWAAWAVTSAAAAYTHYFALFLLLAQGAYALCQWWGSGRPHWLAREGGLAGAALLVAYLPWLPFLLTRYRADVSYWPGALKLDEAVRKIFITFNLGETVLEVQATGLAGWFALILVASILILLIPEGENLPQVPWSAGASQGGRNLREVNRFPYPPAGTIFLLLYLIIPVVLLLALSYRSPKFNPRYAMIASPAFFLTIGGALARAWGWASALARPWSRIICRLPSGLALLFILATSWSADHAWYEDPAFSKADFRGVAAYIRAHIGPEETVILTSGHLFPVFAYYYGPQGWHPIPRMETLDVTRTLDYSVARDLNEALAGRSGVWVVLWQDEVVDPVGFLTMMLDGVGERLPVAPQFWHVRLLHYALPPGVHFSDQPDIQYPLEANFANQIRLLGFSQESLEGAPPVVQLFWQASQPLSEDYRLTLGLRDDEGHDWGDLRPDPRPTGYFYPTFRWKVGQMLFGRYPIPALPGTPPGTYELAAGLYSEKAPQGLDVLDSAGAPQGKRALLGPITLERSVQQGSLPELGIGTATEVTWESIALLGYTLEITKAQPGDLVPLTLFWQARRKCAESYRLALALEDAPGRSLPAGEFPPAGPAYPTDRWQTGEILRGQYTVRIPVAAGPGKARLLASLHDGQGPPIGEPAQVGVLQIEPTARVFTPPAAIQHRSDVTFGGVATLLGANLSTETLSAGGSVEATFYWRAEAAMEKSYTVFTHLLDSQEKVRGGADHLPAGGARPTTGWVPGEVISDTVSMTLDADAPPGEYRLEVGLYDASAPSFPRLPARDGAGNPVGDRAVVATLIVEHENANHQDIKPRSR
jgi:mannosyltransferase